jgi:formylglycine-generating enzyme required for sulfatase activity
VGATSLSRLFISHSSKNDDWAIALKDWVVREGWSGPEDIFLDLDPDRGIAAGEKWLRALEDAATRCEAVLFLVSEDWLASKWCHDEYQLADKLNKKLFALLTADIALDRLPGGLTKHWQIVHLNGAPTERFLTVHPFTQQQSPVSIAEAGLASLKRGLQKAGIGAETFELQQDPHGPFGWRAPYRGLEALEPEDAAVFFGRSADVVSGIDALRGLAARNQPRLLVILGASGAGKSSFLRAGLWPRLLRDDSQWLPLRAIRAGHGGAIEGNEGLLAAIEDVHRRFDLRVSRADLRERLSTPESFVALLRELREAAARRALITEPPYPLPILCLDQGEELFAADASAESERLLKLARAAIDAGDALLLVTIRSDSYGLMQAAQTLAGIKQVPLSLGPVPPGEIGNIVREPAEILRAKAGPQAPVFDAAVVARLQAEIAGEEDALPLLAFVMQRLMSEHAAASTIGLNELERTGGVAAAIESAADAALADAGFGGDRTTQRDALQRLFIPRLARIDPESKAPQRRTAPQANLPPDLLPLAHTLTERRLLVVKLAAEAGEASPDTATLEVAHEALLRRWPTLAGLLAEDRDALLLLDGVLSAAADWDKADAERKPDYLAHRGSRLAEAQALPSRGLDWEREIAPARTYLAACGKAEGDAKRGRRVLQIVSYVLLVAVIVGLVGWMNESYIAAQWRYVTVTWPYARANVWPHVLTAAQEQALKPGDSFKECATDCPEMIVVPAGSFTMGGPTAEQQPQHPVTIAKPFAVAIYETTFADWDACVTGGGCNGYKPNDLSGRGQQPVIDVSWEDAQQYVAWLSEVTGKTYRLLSEAEYEYAARAGTTTTYPWGDDIKLNGQAMANCDGCGSKWDNRLTAPVGSFPPNKFGLYDMVGNVWEWTEDCVHNAYNGAPADGSAWIARGACGRRVLRGGSWDLPLDTLRSAYRGSNSSTARLMAFGFRVGRTLLTP